MSFNHEGFLGTQEVEVHFVDHPEDGKTPLRLRKNGLLVLKRQPTKAITLEAPQDECSSTSEGSPETTSLELMLDVEGTVFEGRILPYELKTLDDQRTNPQHEIARICEAALFDSQENKATGDSRTNRKPFSSTEIFWTFEKQLPKAKLDLSMGGTTKEKQVISVAIKERIVSETFGTIVKVIWKGHLREHISLGPNEKGASSLVFSLGKCVNERNKELRLLRNEVSLLFDQVQEWKKTALSLGADRESREKELLENFLVLHNKTKSNLRSALHALDAERKRKKMEYLDANTQSDSRSLKEDNEGEKEELAFEPDVVQHLASGTLLHEVLRAKDAAAIGQSDSHGPNGEKISRQRDREMPTPSSSRKIRSRDMELHSADITVLDSSTQGAQSSPWDDVEIDADTKMNDKHTGKPPGTKRRKRANDDNSSDPKVSMSDFVDLSRSDAATSGDEGTADGSEESFELF